MEATGNFFLDLFCINFNSFYFLETMDMDSTDELKNV